MRIHSPAKSDSPTDTKPLTSWHKVGLAGLLLISIGYGVITEIRSAFQQVRKTDFGVYCMAGWAVRVGHDPYDVGNERNWHFCYPPPFAVAMVPFADAPVGEPRPWMMPYELSVGLWYALSVLAAAYACHAWAGAVRPDRVTYSQGWWADRVGPFVLTIASIGMTLGRGQVNTIVIAIWAAAFAAAIRQQGIRSGWWLGVAACVKAIPGLLFVIPLMRREGRPIVGGVVAGVALCGLVPLAVWGWPGALEMNVKMVKEILGPGAVGEATEIRAKELLAANGTDNQSFQSAIQTWMHPDPANRPTVFEPLAKRGHWAISAAMLAMTAAVIAWRAKPMADAIQERANQLVEWGLIATVMLLMTPISHMHYHVFAMPLVAGLWLGRPTALTKGVLLAWAIVIGSSLIPIPYWKEWRPFGTCTLATTLLWAYGWGQVVAAKRSGVRRPLNEISISNISIVRMFAR